MVGWIKYSDPWSVHVTVDENNNEKLKPENAKAANLVFSKGGAHLAQIAWIEG